MPEATPNPTVWNGLPQRTNDLVQLTGLKRVSLWRDEKAGLLGQGKKLAGCRQKLWDAETVRRYLKKKHPHLLPS